MKAYLRRIGLDAVPSIDAAGLRKLQRAHLFHVPFENLDIHRDVPIVLDEARFLDKIVAHRRGGFCYELNTAFAFLLRELGFEVALLSANVFGGNGWGIDFDHMLLRVELDEPWIADVGFGDNFLDPIPLDAGRVSAQSIGDFRLTRDDPHWILERRNEGEEAFVAQYRFTNRAYELANFEPGCTYHQSEASHFTRGTICSLATPYGRVTLKETELLITRAGEKTRHPIADATAWNDALVEHFGITLDS